MTMPPKTEKIVYGDGTIYMTLPPYVHGTITGINVPAGWKVPAFTEQQDYLGVDVNRCTKRWQAGVPYAITAEWL